MGPDIDRRRLLAYGATGVAGIWGFNRLTTGQGGPSERAVDGEGTPQFKVESVVRQDESTYLVTFRCLVPDESGIERSSIEGGAETANAPDGCEREDGRVSVPWRPEGDDDRLVWEVRFADGEGRRAATPPHSEVRDQWTLSLSELRERFEQADPTGITVRTGAHSRRTMYVRGLGDTVIFRVSENGVVSYQTDDGWWRVDAETDALLPLTRDDEERGAEDTQANNEYTFTVANSPYDGSQWLSMLLREGGHWGASVFYFYPDHGDVSPGLDPAQPDEVYSRIRFRLAGDWLQTSEETTCKIYWAGCNLSAGSAGKGGTRPTGDDGWSVRIYTRGSESDDSVRIGSYVYHLDQEKRYGDLWEWPDEVAIGKWTHLDTYVKLNSVSPDGSANDDGVLRMALNGELQDERTDVRWRTTEELGVDRLGPGSYWGGSEVSPRDNVIYYDDFEIGEAGSKP